MDLYVLERALKLDEFGDKWKGCEVVLRDPTPAEVKTLALGKTSLEDTLKKHFVSGKAYDGKEIVGMKADDLVNLPLTIYNKLVDFMLPSTSTVATAPRK